MYNSSITSDTSDKPSSPKEWGTFWCTRIEKHWPERLSDLSEKLQELILPFLIQYKCHPTDIKPDELLSFYDKEKLYSKYECELIKTVLIILYSKVCKKTEKTAKIIKAIESLFSNKKRKYRSKKCIITAKKGEDEKILLKMPYNEDFLNKIHSIPEANWDLKSKHWEVSLSIENLNKLRELFEEKIDIENFLFFSFLERELRIHDYSAKTKKAYLRVNWEIVEYCNKNADLINKDDVRRYLDYHTEIKRTKASTRENIVSSLRFFFGKILNKDFIFEIKRPRKENRLPIVLTEEETVKILSALDNLKHRALLMLVYSGGLRVGDVVRLQHDDIDIERGLIRINLGKGKKDRYTILSEIALKALNKYRKTLPEGEEWIFPGQKKGENISIRSAENIFIKTKEIAGITKKATIHTLRHAFATHLLDAGMISDMFKNCWDIKVLKLRRFILMLATKI